MKNDKLNIGDPREELVRQTASVIPFLIKTVVVVGIGWYIVNRYQNRFVKLKENSSYPPANVTQAQAKSRADAIISAKTLFVEFEFGDQYQATANALAGLNYNGFVRVYNEFGHQTGVLFSGDLNLIEYILDQFNAYEVANLSSLQNGAFFKDSIMTPEEQQAVKNLFYGS